MTSSNKGRAIIFKPQCSQCVMFGFADDGDGDLGSQIKLTNEDSPFPLPIAVRPYYVISLSTIAVDIPK